MDELMNGLDDLYELLGKEVDWCGEHFNDDSSINDNYKRGFIEGVKQAQRLLIDFEISLITGEDAWKK